MAESHYVNGFDEFDENFYEEPYEPFNGDDEPNVSYDPAKTTPAYHIQQVEQALKRLKSIIDDSDWKKVLEIKAGIAVYCKGDINDKAPIFMSQHVIEDFTPQSIFAVI